MIDFILLFLLVVCAITAVLMKDLLSSVAILSAYSLIMAVLWMRLNAVDVAFTEAAVSAGITTVLMIAALSKTQRREQSAQKSKIKNPKIEPKNSRLFSYKSIPSLIIVLLTGAVLIYGTIDMPSFGDPNAPANLHVAERYIEKSYLETGSLNFVTAVLASYRGYDTFGEVIVIFASGVCVVLLMRKRKNNE
tara:strand:- start:73 stop:648 length:576 start_codon:yes stop_codon:yes gene_type:complete